MCSICGMVDFINKKNIDEKILKKMGDRLLHRGPDQQGILINEEIGLQHNRLAIMDIAKGIQPMQRKYNGKTYTIIYNGELYNTLELKKELEGYGITFETQCDTEVVLYTYIVFKERCASKLNGIFAFAVYDEKEHEVYIARDRFGIKPFFYTQIESTFLFASEIKGLLAHPKMKAAVDQQGLWQLLYLSPNKIAGTSMFKDIYEMKPGYHGYYRKSGWVVSPYWELKAKAFKGTREEALETTKYLVEDAIKRQLVSDVPLCTFLSGGIDSSLISAVAAEYYKERGEVLHTYSFEYEGNREHFKHTLFQPQRDETYALYLADYLGVHHSVLTVPNERLTALLGEATWYRDLPGMADIDSSLLYYCSEVKKQHTVALSGECADEIFGGYPWFYRPEMLEKDFFPWIHDPHKRVSLFHEEKVRSQEGYDFISAIYKNSLKECPMLDTDTETMKQSRLGTWLSTQYFMTSLLERKDRMSMASGLEVRVPFADHRILEYVFNVPWEMKFEGQVEKALLREAMKEWLPDKILHRKKSPYPKTHNPSYEIEIKKLLERKLQNKESILYELTRQDKIKDLIACDNVTWFGQLMSKPQLMAWLIQLDVWFEVYNINLLN